MCFFKHWVVLEHKPKPEPSLFDFRVLGFGEVVIHVDLLKGLFIQLAPVVTQLIQENEFGRFGEIS
mgnify:CR=1 FL=1